MKENTNSNFEANIKVYKYNENKIGIADENWPVTYILFGTGKKCYIGESGNFRERLKKHISKKGIITSEKLKDFWIIYHNKGNKSLVKWFESDLINRLFADGFNVLNSNEQKNFLAGDLNFYTKEEFGINGVITIWDILHKKGLVEKNFPKYKKVNYLNIHLIKNFHKSERNDISKIVFNLENEKSTIYKGTAGSGKTIICLKIALEYAKKNKNKKIVIYTAKKGNHKMFSNVIKHVQKIGFLNKSIIKKNIMIKKDFSENSFENADLIIIDEAQRLLNNKASLTTKILRKYKDEIEYIEKSNSIFLVAYDQLQSFSKSDAEISRLENNKAWEIIETDEQFRSKGGKDYIQFILEFLEIVPISNRKFDFKEFDFQIFSNPDDLHSYVEKIYNKNNKSNSIRLSSALADTLTLQKNITQKNAPENKFDMKLNGVNMMWNKTSNYSYYNWIQNGSFKEMGSIHTLQGKDLIYSGFIFGKELSYDNGMKIDFKIYGNRLLGGIKSVEEKEEKVKSSYFTMLTRGVEGQAVCIENDSLRKRLIDMKNERVVKKINHH